jgi:hypothetical protein
MLFVAIHFSKFPGGFYSPEATLQCTGEASALTPEWRDAFGDLTLEQATSVFNILVSVWERMVCVRVRAKCEKGGIVCVRVRAKSDVRRTPRSCRWTPTQHATHSTRHERCVTRVRQSVLDVGRSFL